MFYGFCDVSVICFFRGFNFSPRFGGSNPGRRAYNLRQLELELRLQGKKKKRRTGGLFLRSQTLNWDVPNEEISARVKRLHPRIQKIQNTKNNAND